MKNDSRLNHVLSAIAEIKREVRDLRTLLEQNGSVALPSDASDAKAARAAATARGFFLVREFGAVIGRSRQFVSDRCSARVIRKLPGGKPFRIPLTEEARWNNDHKS